MSAPGKNEKQVVYGGVDYKTGKLTYTIADTKCGAAFLVFLIALVAAYAGRKIRLVCDNGRFHHTPAVQQWLAEHKDEIEVYWLPPYSPSLNLIERLWGPLKRTILANVLYRNLDDLVRAFCKDVTRITGIPHGRRNANPYSRGFNSCPGFSLRCFRSKRFAVEVGQGGNIAAWNRVSSDNITALPAIWRQADRH